ncbi:7-carboxy-7-deazaguanine synthase QueE [Peribacillus sp. NPDC097198]|uniref:7-carboxy-7-deazaguanine synthase QueE n=1 Tax=Peribacillus sp. NPDC097198 TaxID=3364397 RepID=UPI003830DBAF
MSRLPVMEIFGPTIQGEGMVIGQKTMFVRTAGCDYSCAWCDSAFTWDGTGKEDIVQMTAEEIWEELKHKGGKGFSFVTISGGNPGLLKNMAELVTLLKEKNIRMGVETQGSRWQDWFLDIDELTISPKPPSSRMETDFEVLDDILAKLSDRRDENQISLKIVVFDEADYQYAKNVHARYPGIPYYLQVGNGDSVTTDDRQLVSELLGKYEQLINRVIADDELNDVKVLPQLHTYIWGNKRGV